MEKIVFNYNLESAVIDGRNLEVLENKISKEIIQINAYMSKKYETDYASLSLPHDQNILSEVVELIHIKKKLCPKLMVVIAIGGSALGTIAIHKSLHGVLYNEQNPPMRVYFADTLDSDYIAEIISIVKGELKKGNNVLINVVTKSGITTETIANFELFLKLLQEYKKNNYKECIVVTTDHGSLLWDYAQQHTISCLGVPKKVGGRYSVFSPVGLFPLGMLDIDLQKLLDGAQYMIQACMHGNAQENIAAISAAMMYLHYNNDIKIHDTFIFSKDLFALGLWYRQLVSESLGKRFDRSGKIVEVSITPTVSLGTTDLHSVAQLYLGGAIDKFTTFVTAKPKKDILLPKINIFEQFVANIQGKPVSCIVDAVEKGVESAYKKNKRPFVSVYIPTIDEFCIGQFLQWKMLEIIYLGYLFNVNPFDQPQVELYKKETRKMLANE